MGLFDYFFPIRVTDDIYNRYIDTGKVPDYILEMIAGKSSKSEVLNEKETVIFCGETRRVNEIIVGIYNKQNKG